MLNNGCIDNVEEEDIGGNIGINRSTKCLENHCGYYATKDDIDYSVKPVVWRYYKTGGRIWSFET